MTECDFQCWVIKDLDASVLFSFGSLILEEASCHVARILKQSHGEVHVRDENLLPAASTNLSGVWMHQLESRSCDPSQSFRWLQPWPTSWLQPHKKKPARTTQLSHSWICGSQKLWDCKHTCIVKSANFGIIYYLTGTTNTKTRKIYFETKNFTFQKQFSVSCVIRSLFPCSWENVYYFQDNWDLKKLWIFAMFNVKVRTCKWFHASSFMLPML